MKITRVIIEIYFQELVRNLLWYYFVSRWYCVHFIFLL